MIYSTLHPSCVSTAIVSFILLLLMKLSGSFAVPHVSKSACSL